MATIRLHVSRDVVSVEGPEDARQSTRALVALAVEAGRVGIASVGEDEHELRERFARPPPPAPARGLRALIVAASADTMPTDAPLQIMRPGDDPWWDRTWQDSRALGSGDVTRRREMLIVAPLAESSWSPHLAQGLLMYVLWTNPWTGDKVWPSFRRPAIELVPASDIRGLHYEELVDQLRMLWGPRRVLLPPELPVGPPPPTRTIHIARASHFTFLAALIGSFALWKSGAPSAVGMGLAVLAVVAFLVRRAALARSKSELPRRNR